MNQVDAPSPEGLIAIERFVVTMSDTDAGQVMYSGAPLRWTERMFSLWLHRLGHPLSEMIARDEGFPVVRAEVDYRSAIRLDDRVTARMWLEKRSLRSVTLRTDFAVGAEPAVSTRLVQVYVAGTDKSPQASPLPRRVTDAFDSAATIDLNDSAL